MSQINEPFMYDGEGTGEYFIFAGGGSGGHLFPGIAVAEALQNIAKSIKILFLCTQRAIDKTILKETKWQFAEQPIRPLPRPTRPTQIWSFWQSFRESAALCEKIFHSHNPSAVIGLGGFASGAAIRTAAKLQLPVAILNPDAVPGKANKFGAKYAQKIFVQWQTTVNQFGKHNHKCSVTGCPIRDAIGDDNENNDNYHQQLGLDSGKKTLAVIGGSLGGKSLNNAVMDALTKKNSQILGDDWQIFHITGNEDLQQITDKYKKNAINAKTVAFTKQIPELLNVANLVIARAGASTLAELTATGKPAILMPYPHHRDQHQLKNAQVLENANAAKIVVDQKDPQKTTEQLLKTLQKCRENGSLEEMANAAKTLGKQNAAPKIAEKIIKIAQNRAKSCKIGQQ